MELRKVAPSALAALAFVLGLAPVARADKTFLENTNFYELGDLVNQHGWTATSETSPVIDNVVPSGTSVGRFARAQDPTNLESSADVLLDTTYSTGTLYSTTLQRLDVGNFDAAGLDFKGGTAFLGVSLNNRFGDGFRLIRDRGGLPQVSDVIGTDAALLHHWFQLDLAANLTTDIMSVRIQDLNGTLDQTFSNTISPTFAANAVEIFASRSGKIALVPEPSSLGMLAMGAICLIRRRKTCRA